MHVSASLPFSGRRERRVRRFAGDATLALQVLGTPGPLGMYAYDAGLSASRSQCEGRWDREISEWESKAEPSPAGLG
jgi:hypothetical protein